MGFNYIEAIKIYLNTSIEDLYKTVEFQDDNDGKGIYISKWNREEIIPTLDELSIIYNNNARNIWLSECVRPLRNQLLQESDYVVLRHKDEEDLNIIDTTISNEQYIQMLQYRSKLRKLTETAQQNDNFIFPEKPFMF